MYKASIRFAVRLDSSSSDLTLNHSIIAITLGITVGGISVKL